MTLVYAPAAHETIGTERLQRLGWGDALLWGFAFLLVASLQGAGLFGLANWRNTPEIPGAPPPAIMIELSEISVAPQVEDIAADDGELSLEQEAATPVETVPAEQLPEDVAEPVETVPEPVTEPVEPEVLELAEAVLPEPVVEPVVEPLDEAEPVPVETAVEPEPVVPEEEIEPLVEPEPIEEVVPDLVEMSEADVFVPLPRQMSPALEQRRQELAQAQQRERQQRERQRREQERERQQQQQQQQQQAASRQSAPRSVEAQAAERPAASQQNSTTRRTPTVSPQRWQSQVIAHLNRMKRYPAESRRRREEGIPHLQFSIDRNGRVLSARIVRSSGIPALDQAAIEMINRASPVPAPPASIPDNRITLTVPVNFNLR